MTNDCSSFQKKQQLLNPTLTHKHIHRNANLLKTPRQVRGMFSPWAIHTSRSSEQRGFSWVRHVCVCVRQWGHVWVSQRTWDPPAPLLLWVHMLSQVRKRRAFCPLPRIQLLGLTTHWQMLWHSLYLSVCFWCLFHVTNSVFNTSGMCLVWTFDKHSGHDLPPHIHAA